MRKYRKTFHMSNLPRYIASCIVRRQIWNKTSPNPNFDFYVGEGYKDHYSFQFVDSDDDNHLRIYCCGSALSNWCTLNIDDTLDQIETKIRRAVYNLLSYNCEEFNDETRVRVDFYEDYSGYFYNEVFAKFIDEIQFEIKIGFNSDRKVYICDDDNYFSAEYNSAEEFARSDQALNTISEYYITDFDWCLPDDLINFCGFGNLADLALLFVQNEYGDSIDMVDVVCNYSDCVDLQSALFLFNTKPYNNCCY